MLTVVPPEIALVVLSFVPLRQLQRLPRVSRAWNDFFAVNEYSIYHAAALLHAFVSSNVRLLDAKASHALWLENVGSWKDLCKKYYFMERRWEGRGQAKCVSIGSAGANVHRIKIDDEQRTVITIHSEGGLRVSAIEEDEVLWSLPESEVCPFAHCEYSKGFLVFTRAGQAMEVWRRKRDAGTQPRPSGLKPDTFQERAHTLAWQSPRSMTQNDRGAFVPWTVITPPSRCQASRLVYPTLSVASPRAQEVYLYDVTDGRLVQTISLKKPQDPSVRIHYIELGARHIFVCSPYNVLILSRDPGDTRVLKFPSDVEHVYDLCAERSCHTIYGSHGEPLYSLEWFASARDVPTFSNCLLEGNNNGFSRTRLRNFTAVHVSPCGSHFAATDTEGCLYIVRHFEQALRGVMRLAECMTILDLRYPITHMAFEGDKRIAIHVEGEGVFLVPFVSEDAISVETLDMECFRRYPRLLHANSGVQADFSFNATTSCIQLTETELWYTWSPAQVDTAFGTMLTSLHYISFADGSRDM